MTIDGLDVPPELLVGLTKLIRALVRAELRGDAGAAETEEPPARPAPPVPAAPTRPRKAAIYRPPPAAAPDALTAERAKRGLRRLGYHARSAGNE
jgi:hypothetical protein